MAMSFGKNENDTMCGVVRVEAQLLQGIYYDIKYKISRAARARLAKQQRQHFVHSFVCYYYNNFQLCISFYPFGV